jgi:hypothetical protein
VDTDGTASGQGDTRSRRGSNPDDFHIRDIRNWELTWWGRGLYVGDRALEDLRRIRLKEAMRRIYELRRSKLGRRKRNMTHGKTFTQPWRISTKRTKRWSI